MLVVERIGRLKHFPCGRRVQTTGQNLTNLVKKGKIVEFHDHIWNQYEICIQINTTMTGMGYWIINS